MARRGADESISNEGSGGIGGSTRVRARVRSAESGVMRRYER